MCKYNTSWRNENIIIQSPQAKRLKKCKKLDDGASVLGKFGNVAALKVEDSLSLEDFLEKFKKSGNPVLIPGAANDWPALEDGGEHRWSIQYLKKVKLRFHVMLGKIG